ncbi:glucose dehydrogenase [FAD, quinone]-like, partial [Ostrinia furnacalis]|uniref:glucose dehydrogenase [FAD, quinone]-like n=1 Tax=Ostrinia furnacalis TaxID=93504 RepID=UPI00103FE8A5
LRNSYLFDISDGETFDFVVVGSGSAGAVVAARLSEAPHLRVLLVEAGGDPPLASVVPSFFTTLSHTEYDWDYSMKLDRDVGRAHTRQAVNLLRGKMLGGSSAINYELYARGEPRDYDSWEQVAPGWDWHSTLKYFKKLENMTDSTVMNSPHNSHLHSTEGAVKISKPAFNEYFRTVNEIILQAYEEMGLKRTLEMNGLESLGVSLPHFTFADGRRSSTAECYLKPTKDRPNLSIAKYTRALKVLIDPYTLTAYGVKLLTKTGRLVNVFANKEVILSAGAIDTPKLLMLSGVGPREELEKHAIESIVDLPVGRNLQDHQFVPLIFTGKRGLGTVVQHLISSRELNSVPVPTQNGFINVDNGPYRQLQTFNSHIGAFGSPVIQLTCESLGYKRSFCASIARANFGGAIDWTFLILLHPESRGRVTIKSKNPLDDPVIESGFLRSKEDVRVLKKGVKFMQKLTKTSYYRHVQATLEKLDVPGCDKAKLEDGEYWHCYVVNTVGSLQHPVGTCAMGPDGVVDERLKVHGVSRLRVIDASVMPTIPGGNTNAPAMMVGEKGADIIKEDYHFFVDESPVLRFRM